MTSRTTDDNLYRSEQRPAPSELALATEQSDVSLALPLGEGLHAMADNQRTWLDAVIEARRNDRALRQKRSLTRFKSRGAPSSRPLDQPSEEP